MIGGGAPWCESEDSPVIRPRWHRRGKGCNRDNHIRRCHCPISGYDIGHHLVFAPADFVAQAQFAFFQAGELQLVEHNRCGQRIDGVVQVAVFDLQQFQTLANIFPVHDIFCRMQSVRPQDAPHRRIGMNLMGDFSFQLCFTHGFLALNAKEYRQ